MRGVSARFVLLLFAPLLCALAVDNEQSLGILVDVGQELPPAVRRSMEREFESLVSTRVLAIRWRVPDDEASGEVFDRIVVVRFHGACKRRVPEEIAIGSRTLGFTHVSEGRVLPFAEVECNLVRSILRPMLRTEGRLERDVLVGRGLGRVHAHEVYHILTRSTHHSGRGVARETLTLRDLTCNPLVFDSECAGQIRLAMKLARR